MKAPVDCSVSVPWVGAVPVWVKVEPATALSLVPTLPFTACPACTATLSSTALGLTIKATLALAQLLGDAASQIWYVSVTGPAAAVAGTLMVPLALMA